MFTHSLDSVLEHPGIAARQRGIADLSAACQRCPVVSSCGGGMYAHRYKSGSGFDNPSVYCADLLKLISHISARLPHVAGNRAGGPRAQRRRARRTRLGTGRRRGDRPAQRRPSCRCGAGCSPPSTKPGIGAPAVPAPARDRLRTAWQALALADGDGPDAVDAVLGHPYLRAWAVRCLGRLGRGDAAAGDGDRSLAADLGHLGAVAAAVAIRGRGPGAVDRAADRRRGPPAGTWPARWPGRRLAVPTARPRPSWRSTPTGCGCASVPDGWRLPRPRMLAGEPCPAEPCTPDGAPAATGTARRPCGSRSAC